MSHWISQFAHRLTAREAVTSAIDILVVYYFIYRALLLVKGTRAAQMLTAIVLGAGAFYLARVFELTTVLWLLDNLINYSIIFLIVIFQQDIRRGLSSIGTTLFGSSRQYEETYVFEEVIKAAEQLARTRTGALIVFQREADLEEFMSDPGGLVEARVTKELLVTLFVPSPLNQLHDGAVIIRDLRLFRAGCVMPLSTNRKLDKSLGTRHRAAIGITEETDAVVVVVSEERGTVSLCFGGNIAADLDAATLRKALLGLFQMQKRPSAASRKGTPSGVGARRASPTEVTQKTSPFRKSGVMGAVGKPGTRTPTRPMPVTSPVATLDTPDAAPVAAAASAAAVSGAPAAIASAPAPSATESHGSGPVAVVPPDVPPGKN